MTDEKPSATERWEQVAVALLYFQKLSQLLLDGGSEVRSSACDAGA